MVSELSGPLVSAGLALVVGSVILTVGLHCQVIRSIQAFPQFPVDMCIGWAVSRNVGGIIIFKALSRAPVTVVSPIYALTPDITLILAHTFLRRLESIDFLLVAGTMLSVVGVIFFVPKTLYF